MRSMIGWMVPAAAIALAGCATTTPGARPDDMSAAEHRRVAAEHAAKAKAHERKYDPKAVLTRSGGGGGRLDVTDEVYNPTEGHLAEAERHRKHARDHLAAAETLERFEDEMCGPIPPKERARCPLMGTVASVEDVEGGVRMRFKAGVDVKRAEAHIRCHLAFARKQGRKGMDRCPLYVPGVTAKPQGSAAVDLLLDEDHRSLLEELRKRSAAHVAP